MAGYTRLTLLFTLVLLITLIPTLTIGQRVPPSIVPADSLPGTYYKPETSITLPCEATGTPQPRYEWIFNGAVLSIQNKGELEIQQANRDEQGYYQCKAINEHGTSLSTVVHLQMAALRYEGGDKDKVMDVNKQAGEPLEVQIRGQLESQPTAVFKWNTISSINDDSPVKLPLSQRVIQSKEGSLFFTYLEDADAALLKVAAFNDYLDQVIGGSYTRITVRSNAPNARNPVPVYPPPGATNVIILEGEELELQCIFNGYPLVEVSWSPPTGVNGEAYKINGTYRVKHVSQQHEGTYQCVGTNTGGKASNYITVDVQTRPKFAMKGKPESVNKTEGETVSFRCQARDDAEPKATITWLFNGQPVDVASPGPRTSLTEDNTLLTITDLKLEDLRVLQCNVSNTHDYVFADVVLNVFKPEKSRDISFVDTLPAKYDQAGTLACFYNGPGFPVMFSIYAGNHLIFAHQADRYGEIYRHKMVNYNGYVVGPRNLTMPYNDWDIPDNSIGEYSCEVVTQQKYHDGKASLHRGLLTSPQIYDENEECLSCQGSQVIYVEEVTNLTLSCQVRRVGPEVRIFWDEPLDVVGEGSEPVDGRYQQFSVASALFDGTDHHWNVYCWVESAPYGSNLYSPNIVFEYRPWTDN